MRFHEKAGPVKTTVSAGLGNSGIHDEDRPEGEHRAARGLAEIVQVKTRCDIFGLKKT